MEQAAAAETTSFFLLYIAGGLGNCVLVFLALYNLIALIGVMRSDDDEGSASGLAKGAWGIGCLSALIFPCAPFLSLVALALSRIEIGRVYRDESSLASATPARMGSVNGGVAFLVWCLVTFGLALSFAL